MIALREDIESDKVAMVHLKSDEKGSAVGE
jgi:hypothetical protein